METEDHLDLKACRVSLDPQVCTELQESKEVMANQVTKEIKEILVQQEDQVSQAHLVSQGYLGLKDLGENLGQEENPV